MHAIKPNCMQSHNSKIFGEGLTYDDVLLIPAYSEVLPREVSIKTKFTKNIELNINTDLRKEMPKEDQVLAKIYQTMEKLIV